MDLSNMSPRSQAKKLASMIQDFSSQSPPVPVDPLNQGGFPETALPPLDRYYFAPFDPERLGVATGPNARTELLILVRQAESCERWHDMALLTRRLAVATQGKLSREERNLFAIAHKHVVLPHRQALRVLSQNLIHPVSSRLAAEYRKHVEYELKTFCQSLAEFIAYYLLNRALELPDHRIFFLKLVGDLYRYIAELNPLRDSDACRLCRSYYHDAALLSERYLPITSPIRLGLLLNYAVAAFELFRDYKTACEMIKCAFDKAIHRLDELDEEDYRDATLLLQLMRDNLSLWVAMQHHHVPAALQFPPAYEIQKVYTSKPYDDGSILPVNDARSHEAALKRQQQQQQQQQQGQQQGQGQGHPQARGQQQQGVAPPMAQQQQHPAAQSQAPPYAFAQQQQQQQQPQQHPSGQHAPVAAYNQAPKQVAPGQGYGYGNAAPPQPPAGHMPQQHGHAHQDPAHQARSAHGRHQSGYAGQPQAQQYPPQQQQQQYNADPQYGSRR
jgi:hypothetical protein